MQKIGLLFMLLALMACTKENHLRLSNSPRALELLPSVPKAGLKFFSSAGDTITLAQLSKNQSFTQTVPLSESIGGSGKLDYVELEQNKLVLGTDTPYLRFQFQLDAIQSNTEGRGAYDRLQLSWQDENSASLAELTLRITDSIMCEGSNCAYADTLSLSGERSYTEVYYIPRSSGINRIFINEGNGLIAFSTNDSLTFERIP